MKCAVSEEGYALKNVTPIKFNIADLIIIDSNMRDYLGNRAE